jgi:pimeloyl-ACP methyl ester carboxylesterase
VWRGLFGAGAGARHASRPAAPSSPPRAAAAKNCARGSYAACTAGHQTWPLPPWRTLGRDRYRAALRSGVLAPGIFVEEGLDPNKPTVVFIHGAQATPSQLATLAAALGDRINAAVFVWDDTARLAFSAELLRVALMDCPDPIVVVAHSMGTLLPAYIGATDGDGHLRALRVVYLNPLIGGSRYAGDFRALRWLGVGPLITRAFFRPCVLDLAPESEFEQTIFGPASAAPSFAARTMVLFTERPGEEPDIRRDRVPYYFGRTREELLGRIGRIVRVPNTRACGHDAPLVEPTVVLAFIEEILNAQPQSEAAGRGLDEG